MGPFCAWFLEVVSSLGDRAGLTGKGTLAYDGAIDVEERVRRMAERDRDQEMS